MFLYPTNAFRSFASGLEAHVGQRPVRGGEAIKTHRKGAISREISQFDLVISKIIYNFVTVVIITAVIKYEVL